VGGFSGCSRGDSARSGRSPQAALARTIAFGRKTLKDQFTTQAEAAAQLRTDLDGVWAQMDRALNRAP